MAAHFSPSCLGLMGKLWNSVDLVFQILFQFFLDTWVTGSLTQISVNANDDIPNFSTLSSLYCIMGKHQKRLRYPISQKSRQDTFVLPSSQEKLPIFEQVGSRYILYCIATLGLKLLTVENMQYQVFTLLTYLHTIFLRLRCVVLVQYYQDKSYISNTIQQLW